MPDEPGHKFVVHRQLNAAIVQTIAGLHWVLKTGVVWLWQTLAARSKARLGFVLANFVRCKDNAKNTANMTGTGAGWF